MRLLDLLNTVLTPKEVLVTKDYVLNGSTPHTFALAGHSESPPHISKQIEVFLRRGGDDAFEGAGASVGSRIAKTYTFDTEVESVIVDSPFGSGVEIVVPGRSRPRFERVSTVNAGLENPYPLFTPEVEWGGAEYSTSTSPKTDFVVRRIGYIQNQHCLPAVATRLSPIPLNSAPVMAPISGLSLTSPVITIPKIVRVHPVNPIADIAVTPVKDGVSDLFFDYDDVVWTAWFIPAEPTMIFPQASEVGSPITTGQFVIEEIAISATMRGICPVNFPTLKELDDTTKSESPLTPLPLVYL